MRACFGFDWAESAVAQRCTRACSSSAASTPITPAAAIASSNGTTPSEHVAVARMLSWRRKTELVDESTNALVTGTMVRSKKGFIARSVDRDQAKGCVFSVNGPVSTGVEMKTLPVNGALERC